MSVLIITTSQQVGTTFGEFNIDQENTAVIEACQVFPSEIQKLLSGLHGHLDILTTLKHELASGTDMAGSLSDSYAYSGGSLEELSLQEQFIMGRISSLQAAAHEAASLSARNEATWQSIRSEVTQAAGIANQLIGTMGTLNPNCAEIKEQTILDQLSDQLKLSQILSSELTTPVQKLLEFFRIIRLSGYPDLLNPEQMPSNLVLSAEASEDGSILQSAGSLVPVSGSADELISPDLTQYYNDVQARNQSRISTYSTSLERLISQLSGVQTAIAAEKQRLEELEKAKVKQAETEKARKEAEDKESAKPDPKLPTSDPLESAPDPSKDKDSDPAKPNNPKQEGESSSGNHTPSVQEETLEPGSQISDSPAQKETQGSSLEAPVPPAQEPPSDTAKKSAATIHEA